VSAHTDSALGPGEHAPLTWSTGAMTPAGLTAVCAEVSARERPTVVECGSGYSSLRLAEFIHARAGRLISLEHDASWAARVDDALVAAGFAETAHIVRAPLEPHPLGRDGLRWYAEHALRSLPRRIDVLLVDGPPAFEPGAGLSRYPALPALAARLTPDAVVVLDDIDRRGELQVLHAWEHDTDFRFHLRKAERIALGQRSPRRA
jgi:predicted O-methyltransferase YrrM